MESLNVGTDLTKQAAKIVRDSETIFKEIVLLDIPLPLSELVLQVIN